MKSYHQCSPVFIVLSVRLSNRLSISIITGPNQISPSTNIEHSVCWDLNKAFINCIAVVKAPFKCWDDLLF